MLICVADKIYNLQALVRDYEMCGDGMWDFIQPGLKDKLWYHDGVVTILEERMQNRRALNALNKELQRAKGILTNSEREDATVSHLLPSGVLTWIDFSSLRTIAKKESQNVALKGAFC